jgi:predicted transglutaminase-like cysteine proteinase
MRDDGYALAPFSFVKFCIDYPDECPDSGGLSRIVLTALRLAQLNEVNLAVNAAIAPTPDTSNLRYWRLNVAAGDCNSFAIQKRHELLARGWPAGALALTVAKTSTGEGHLLVTVRTDQGDLVLDNLRSRIVSWRQTGYQFIMRQSEENPQFWVELHGGHVGQAFAARRLDGAEELTDAARSSQANERQSAELSITTVSKPADQTADERVAYQAVNHTLRRAVHPGLENEPPPAQVSDRAGALIAALAPWLNHSFAAKSVEGFAGDLARLIDTRNVAEAERANAVADLTRSIDPTAYGFM